MRLILCFILAIFCIISLVYLSSVPTATVELLVITDKLVFDRFLSVAKRRDENWNVTLTMESYFETLIRMAVSLAKSIFSFFFKFFFNIFQNEKFLKVGFNQREELKLEINEFIHFNVITVLSSIILMKLFWFSGTCV